MQRKTEKQQNEKDYSFRKIGNIKGRIHPKMGTIKERNNSDLVEVKEIKKRWKECMKNCTKKGPN